MATQSERRLDERGRLGAYGWQLLLRAVVIVGYAAYFSANEWTWTGWMTGGAIAAGILLFAAGAIGLFGVLRRPGGLGLRLLRLGDGVVDLLFGGILVATAFSNPVEGLRVFAIWAIIAGLLLVIHAVPSRLRDMGPAWAWIWTGLPLVLTGIYTLIVGVYSSVTGFLWLNAYALAAGTMSSLLGFGVGYPYILAMPRQESSGETMFAYDDVHWRKTPPDLERMHDLDEPSVAEKPEGGDRAA